MSARTAISLVLGFFVSLGSLEGQTAPKPDENPEGNTGALKPQITTGGSYDAHSGNATRIVNDLHVPGALGAEGLDFTRYWNSLLNDSDNPYAVLPRSFGPSNWSHSWEWYANEEDTSENISGDGSEEIYTTAITVTFPDGHATRYKITRSDRGHYSNGVLIPPDPRCGPNYTVPEQNGFLAAGWPHDTLNDMAADGSQFWLYRSDGSSVHFIGGPGVYHVSEMFDPHGLRTEFQYYADGRLYQVIQEGGRYLTINWSDYGDMGRAISSVQSVTPAGGSQTVSYTYDSVPLPGSGGGTETDGGPSGGGGGTNGSSEPSGWMALRTVVYPEGATARYNYQLYFGDDPSGVSGYPLLKYADDPHYAGAMTKIRYAYQASNCPNPAPGPFNADYFPATALAIAYEKSGDTNMAVSSFSINCFDGTRMESSGLGGWRMFYFGHSAGYQGTGEHLGYQLIKLTDFTNQYPLPGNLPFDRQNWMQGQPHQIWDARGIETDAIVTQYNPTTGQFGDGSGSPSEIHHVTADGSYQVFDRINLGASDAQDYTRVPNRFNRWLYSHRDERGLTTYYTRDSRRRVRRIDYPGGWYEVFTYNDLNQVTYHLLTSGAAEYFGYDGYNRLVCEYNSVDGWDARKEYVYDDPFHPDLPHKVIDARARSSGAAYSTRMEYDAANRVVEVHYAATSDSPDPHVTYGYDDHGNCTSITDEMGCARHYEYDSYRRCTSYREPLNRPDWNRTGWVSERRWDWLYDRWVVGIGPRDQSTHTKNEWRIQIEPAFNAAGGRRMTARAHDLQNRIVVEQTGWIQPPGQIGPDNPWYYVDDLETHYFGYDADGNKSTYIDPMGRTTTYDYDLRNRLWRTNETVNTVPRTTETLYDVTGNKTDVNFPDAKSQHWRDYDAFGQAYTFIDELNNPTNLTYWWGPMKKLRTVKTHRDTDGGGAEDQLTTFMNDGLGRPVQTLFPDASHEDLTYECKDGVYYLCDQPHTWTTRKGQKKTITYDARGREDHHTWENDAAPAIYRAWDPASRLTSIWNSVASISFGYDDAAQLYWETEYVAGADTWGTTSYYRYADGQVGQMTYPNGLLVQHDYTARGQLNSVSDNGNGPLKQSVRYHYLADGKAQHQDYYNGTTTTFGYDGRGMISSVQHTKTANGQNLSSRNYYRDDRDRITAWQKSTNNSVNPMEDGRGDLYYYDAEGQLTHAYYGAADPAGSPNNWQREDHFYLDALGNRRDWDYVQTKGWQNFTRKDNGLNQYRMWSPYSMINYDDDIAGWGSPGAANGVLMQDGWITAGYNALNQPMLAWSPAYNGTSNWMFFGYDPLGRCVKRWVAPLVNGWLPPMDSNPATYYYYDGWNLIQDGPQSWNAEKSYIHGARVDEIVASYRWGWDVAYHHYDARGHCTLLTDSTGTIREQYDYDAFGYPYFYDASGNNVGYSLFANRFLFTGREWLSDLKLYDYRNRLYQPELGRFLQPDPKEFAAGDYNLYRYSHNDPINKSDPTGSETLTRPDIDSQVGDRVAFVSQVIGQMLANLGDTYEQWIAQPFAQNFGFPLENAVPQLSEMHALSSLSAVSKPLQTTAHGAERLAGAAATRGGVLRDSAARLVQQTGMRLTQADGATVHVVKTEAGRYNVVISNQAGKVISTFENMKEKKFEKLAKRYGYH